LLRVIEVQLLIKIRDVRIKHGEQTTGCHQVDKLDFDDLDFFVVR